jgi:hypothetical protein
MTDQEVIEHINKYCEERECMKCAIWDSAAREYGKRGMCGECFDMHYIPIECNIERLGMPLLIEWENKEELIEEFPT